MADVIRNCNFILQCPTYWDALGETEEPGVRYCEACQRKVYLCKKEQELQLRIELNQCVAVQLPKLQLPTVGVPSRWQDREGRED